MNKIDAWPFTAVRLFAIFYTYTFTFGSTSEPVPRSGSTELVEVSLRSCCRVHQYRAPGGQLQSGMAKLLLFAFIVRGDGRMEGYRKIRILHR